MPPSQADRPSARLPLLGERPDLSPLRIEIERDTRPISGRLRIGAGEPVPFVGWLELIAAVERSGCGPGLTPDPPMKRPDQG
jgi:hypothetical protein